MSQYLQLAAYYWYNEHQVTPMDAITSLYYPSNYEIGHFTMLIHDKSYAVGCAAVQWTEDNGNMKVTRITCNYPKGISNYLLDL